MELRHLHHFLAVAEELHFARAAERLGMEQSPLSHSIRNLEADLRIKLFNRTTRRTWLTRAGTRFYEHAKRILIDIEAAKASLHTDDDEPTPIRLALGEDLAGEPFTRLLFELEHCGSGTAAEIHELSHADAVRLVRNGGADLVLTLDGRPVEGFAQRRGWGERLMLVVPIGHALAERDQVSLSELGAGRLALPPVNICSGYLEQIEELFRSHQVAVLNRITVRHWNTAISFAATGRAMALCPASFVNGATSVAVIPIAEAAAELVTWLLYSDVEVSPAAALVLDLVALIEAPVLIASDPGRAS